MSDDQSTFAQIKALLKEAYDAFNEFVHGVAEIKKEEQQIIAEAHQRTDAKKLALIKSKIDSL